MAQIRNLENPGNKSFISFSDSRISSNLDKLGISLGIDDNGIRCSTVAIKNIEMDILVVYASHRSKNKNNTTKNSKYSTIIDYSDDEEEERLEETFNHICGDIYGDPQEHSHDHDLCDLKVVPRKKKSGSANKIKNGRPPKKPNTPSKIRLR
jgi:hypothetical protein